MGKEKWQSWSVFPIIQSSSGYEFVIQVLSYSEESHCHTVKRMNADNRQGVAEEEDEVADKEEALEKERGSGRRGSIARRRGSGREGQQKRRQPVMKWNQQKERKATKKRRKRDKKKEGKNLPLLCQVTGSGS